MKIIKPKAYFNGHFWSVRGSGIFCHSSNFERAYAGWLKEFIQFKDRNNGFKKKDD